MKETEIYKDILQYRISSQSFYNENLVTARNPEIRQIFTQLRDDEMRAVMKLQQRIDRLEASSGIVARIFPAKPKY